ncbi:MAG: hypothetical protein A2651_02055 [Candidatus Yanofskybacteria bacterium RIFCSPHIGHO2_01_FULL_42_12]|uniref:Uncharacterized protein n=1 Tax=Candidatus Yanofskybacteria bacterium RIFCSPLOWO2_01_FULL_42_49 TaxID=1802694 RepID=A0A1F8GDN2_9BACT|nr:MAG: hypothetical protein A2651_02055 [Candidatus Yanofskybacteria bacterium RIFCSPHIGHO2_01_FULL_42_12]OGN23495.1 MAG: hypothetical protein A2918_00360 [Candidatus Yanofskybacteria bacterium RIFCSPLOWO2_01_FULL_42_49]
MYKEHLPKQELSADKLTPAEEKAFDLLIAERSGTATNMSDFIEVEGYGEERIRRDKERVERKKREKKNTVPNRQEKPGFWR